MRGLHAEEEGGGEVLVGEDAGDEGVIVHVLQQIVSVIVSDAPPDDTEYQPGEHEAGEEGHQSVAPFQIKNRDKNILKQCCCQNTLTDTNINPTFISLLVFLFTLNS